MQAWWQMWHGYFGPDWCQGVISDGLKVAPQEGSIGHGGANRLDEDYRSSKIRWLSRPAWDHLHNKVGILVKEANNNAFGFDLNLMREIQFTEYRAENEDHYKWHEDLSWRVNKASHRKLSVVIQLSDQGDYEGGDLELQHEAPEPEALKRQGTVIVFPSFHSHRVTPITKGVRYSLVAWYEGPKFK